MSRRRWCDPRSRCFGATGHPRERFFHFGVGCWMFDVGCSPFFFRRNPSQPGSRGADCVHKNIFWVGRRMSVPFRQSERVNGKTNNSSGDEGRGSRAEQLGKRVWGLQGKAACPGICPRHSTFVARRGIVPVWGAKSNIEHRTSNIEHRTSNIEHPTSNIQHRTIDSKALPFPGSAFSARHSTLDTRHSSLHFTANLTIDFYASENR
jgi:hypothetical protein